MLFRRLVSVLGLSRVVGRVLVVRLVRLVFRWTVCVMLSLRCILFEVTSAAFGFTSGVTLVIVCVAGTF